MLDTHIHSMPTNTAQPMSPKKLNRGLTFIELLVALAVLAVILGVVMGGMQNLFKIMRESENKLQSNTQIQALAEAMRQQWRTYPYLPNPHNEERIKQKNYEILQKNIASLLRYDRNCLAITEAEGTDLERHIPNIQVTVLDRYSRPLSTLPVVAKPDTENCATIPYPDYFPRIPLKRVQLNLDYQGEAQTLTMDIARPQVMY